MVQHVEQVKHKGGNAAPQASLDAHGVVHNRPLTPEERREKQDKEITNVSRMIGIYCHGVHKSAKGQLCDECRDLLEYASARIRACRVMDTKTFCSSCKIHCYAPAKREQIRQVMRYAGPRMMLVNPGRVLEHIIDSRKARAFEKQNNSTQASK